MSSIVALPQCFEISVKATADAAYAAGVKLTPPLTASMALIAVIAIHCFNLRIPHHLYMPIVCIDCDYIPAKNRQYLDNHNMALL
jgi:hypothetical protein